MWWRVENSVLLTSEELTITSDRRISVVHVPYKNQWDLMIKNVQAEDEGMYECQISSKNRSLRRLVALNVIGELLHCQ